MAEDVSSLTTVAVDGTGVFDVLMQTLKLHLAEEFNSGRIDGERYSDVYVAALVAVLQQSVAYLLSQENVKKIAAETALIGQKITTELANTDDSLAGAVAAGYALNDTSDVQGIIAPTIQKTLLEADLVEQKIVTELGQTSDIKPAGLGQEVSVNIDGLISGQRLLNEKQATLLDTQNDVADTEKVLTGQRIITELAQTDDNIGPGVALGYGLNDGSDIQGVTKSAIDQVEMETLLIEQKMVSELGQSSDTKPLTLGQNETTTAIDGLIASKKAIDALQADLVTSQISVSDSEKALMGQKIITELAQTGDSLTNAQLDSHGFNVSAVIEGTVKSKLDTDISERLLIDQKTESEKGQVNTITTGLIGNKITNDIKQGELIDNQILTSKGEADLVGQKIISELAQTATNISQANVAGYGYNADNTVEGILKGISDKSAAEASLLTEKITTETNQANKVLAEKALLDEKKITESAQTGAVAHADSLLGKQTTLYQRQADGYLRDAEQKLSKIMADAWTVDATMNSVEVPTGLGTAALNTVLGIAKTGIS